MFESAGREWARSCPPQTTSGPKNSSCAVQKEFTMKLAKAPPVVSDINVTPMVDVMLVLLIIFMVITPMLSKGQTVNMVKTHNPIKMQEADKEDAVLIAVTRDGKVFLSPGNSLIQLDQLSGKVKDLQQSRTDKTVYIKA